MAKDLEPREQGLLSFAEWCAALTPPMPVEASSADPRLVSLLAVEQMLSDVRVRAIRAIRLWAMETARG